MFDASGMTAEGTINSSRSPLARSTSPKAAAAGARRILAEFWSGDGPHPATWRFDLKAEANDAAGHSFAVHVPDDEGRDDILRAFVADALARRPTRVFLKGRLFTFAAPTNAVSLTGLNMEIESSKDIQFRPPDEP